MGHRHKDKHKSRHRKHLNKPLNLSQGSRKISSRIVTVPVVTSDLVLPTESTREAISPALENVI